MKKIKGVIGIILIVTAALGMFLWEAVGREKLLYTEILATTDRIERGEILTSEMVETMMIPRENVAEGSILSTEKNQYIGRKLKQMVPGNSQISGDFFYMGEDDLVDGKSIFVIKPEWIFAMSASIRRGDVVELYYNGGAEKLEKTFSVAFVKDSAGREVINVEGLLGNEILDRRDGTAPPSSIEIIALKEDYDRILQIVGSGQTFIIVQREEGINGN